MLEFQGGRFLARTARTPAEIEACQRLRHRAFRGTEGLDRDRYDTACTHVRIEDPATDTLVGCFRLLELADGRSLDQSYSAQFYGLHPLAGFDAPMAEMGRFCLAPGWKDPDILRVAWGALTRYVDAVNLGMLFGCSSFSGTDPMAYADTFALLRERHLAPEALRPAIAAPRVFPFATRITQRPDLKAAMAGMPTLLRSYLTLGGWVSDHAVIDPDMNTVHVFTGLEIRAIPESRKRLMRAMAG